jgi:hypothetical protein
MSSALGNHCLLKIRIRNDYWSRLPWTLISVISTYLLSTERLISSEICRSWTKAFLQPECWRSVKGWHNMMKCNGMRRYLQHTRYLTLHSTLFECQYESLLRSIPQLIELDMNCLPGTPPQSQLVYITRFCPRLTKCRLHFKISPYGQPFSWPELPASLISLELYHGRKGGSSVGEVCMSPSWSQLHRLVLHQLQIQNTNVAISFPVLTELAFISGTEREVVLRSIIPLLDSKSLQLKHLKLSPWTILQLEVVARISTLRSIDLTGSGYGHGMPCKNPFGEGLVKKFKKFGGLDWKMAVPALLQLTTLDQLQECSFHNFGMKARLKDLDSLLQRLRRLSLAGDWHHDNTSYVSSLLTLCIIPSTLL